MKFAITYCSQCGQQFGPGDSGYSHCTDHQPKEQTMIRHADVLAFCRASPTTEEIIAMLSAITGTMGVHDPVCELLDAVNDKLMDLQEAQRLSELWEADDRDCRRAQSLMPASSIPAFLREAV
jgi:hypothetical protein